MKRRIRRRDPLLIGAGALVVLAGCAHAPMQKTSAAAARVEPVYRVQQPVGTAAGQYAVGRMELAAGRVDAAIMRFTRALQLDPSLVEAHNGLGIAYGQQGRFNEAAAAFRAALGHAPDAPHLLNNLGYALMRAGRLDDAWASLARAHRLDRTNPLTRDNLVQLAAAREATAPPANVALAPAAPTAVAPAPAAPIQPTAAALPASSTQPTAATLPATPMQPTVAPAVLAASTGVVVKAVAQPAASTSGAFSAVVVQSDQSRLEQVAPGVLELRPAAATSTVAAASPAATMPAAAVPVTPPVAVELPAAMAAAVAVVPTAPGRSSGAQAASPQAASPQVIMPPPAKLGAPPAATLASVRGAAPVDGFEVSNGVGIRHLAGRMARALDKLGVSVDRVSDYRWFGIRRSEIHYRDGHRDQALTVAGTLPVHPRLVRSARMQPSINVRLVVGRDLSARQVAWLGEESLLQADLAEDSAPVGPSPTLRSEGAPAEVIRIASLDSARGWRHF